MSRQNLLITKLHAPLAQKKNILVIEDDPSISEILKIILERSGYEVELKADSSDVVKGEYTIPDLFLLDRQIPGMNGLDLCCHLKQQKATRDIPVVIISASPDINRLSREAGADDYIEKPFEINHLLKVVDVYCRQRDKATEKKTAG